MKKAFLYLVALGLLSACAGVTPVIEPARFDLGAPASVSVALKLPLAGIDVESSSWLTSRAMQYRLQYADPLRRNAYAESRWVAPPGELIAGFMKRQLAAAPSSGGCQLRIALDEFEQRFDQPGASQMVIEIRASLSATRGGDILARRGFQIAKPAASADARGGAAAAQAAAMALASELAAWADGLARATPALADRCRN